MAYPRYVVEYPLWKYYSAALSLLFAHNTLGSGDPTAALMKTSLLHLLASTVGGAAAVALAAWARRRRQD